MYVKCSTCSTLTSVAAITTCLRQLSKSHQALWHEIESVWGGGAKIQKHYRLFLIFTRQREKSIGCQKSWWRGEKFEKWTSYLDRWKITFRQALALLIMIISLL